MDNTVLVALISSGGSVLVAVTALVLNYRGFASIDARMLSLENRVDSRIVSLENRVDARLNLMQADMKDLNKAMAALDADMGRIKDKVGM